MPPENQHCGCHCYGETWYGGGPCNPMGRCAWGPNAQDQTRVRQVHEFLCEDVWVEYDPDTGLGVPPKFCCGCGCNPCLPWGGYYNANPWFCPPPPPACQPGCAPQHGWGGWGCGCCPPQYRYPRPYGVTGAAAPTAAAAAAGSTGVTGTSLEALSKLVAEAYLKHTADFERDAELFEEVFNPETETATE